MILKDWPLTQGDRIYRIRYAVLGIRLPVFWRSGEVTTSTRFEARDQPGADRPYVIHAQTR